MFEAGRKHNSKDCSKKLSEIEYHNTTSMQQMDHQHTTNVQKLFVSLCRYGNK